MTFFNTADRSSKGERIIVSPAPGNPFTIAVADIAEAIRLSPMWLHGGWINVVWRFRRTRLGPFWHTLGLGGFILTMGVIWSSVLKQDLWDYFRSLAVNMIVWSMIASFITEGTGTLVNGQSTALSMRFPFIAFAFANVWRALLLLAHHSVLYLIVILVTMRTPGVTGLLAIPALILIAANGIWLSLFFGMLCLRWRDLGPATATAMQVLMLATPVFWPREMLGPEYALAADLNPLYHFLRIVREPLLGTLPPAVSWIWVVGTLIVGTFVTLWTYGRYRYRIPYWY